MSKTNRHEAVKWLSVSCETGVNRCEVITEDLKFSLSLLLGSFDVKKLSSVSMLAACGSMLLRVM